MKNIFLCIVAVTAIFLIQCERERDKSLPSGTPSVSGTLPAELQSMIGLEFGPDSFPGGFEEHTGYVMGYLENDEYIIDHVSKDSLQALWFCKLTRRDSEGRPYLKIIDILFLPAYASNESLLMGTCQANGEFDPEIIAIVKFIQHEVKSEIRHAWRANRQIKKFQSISRENISCLDESYFL